MDQNNNSPQMREYLVILNNLTDLESFKTDIENPGGNLYIPNRAVAVFANLTNSAVTGYLLTDQEADQVKHDPRVKSVHLSYKEKGYKLKSSWTQTSNRWARSTSLNPNDKNWGLLRSMIPNNFYNWASSGNPIVADGITVPLEGSNVDVVIIDTAIQEPMHPEFWKPTAAWKDPKIPETRALEYNWLPHALTVLDSNTSQTQINLKTVGNVHFYLDNALYNQTQQNPTLWLVRGWEYTIEVNCPGNPVAIKTELGIGDNDLWSEIINNVIETGTIIFPAYYSGPIRLFYQSTTNPDLFGTIEIVNSYTYNTWIFRPNESLDHGISVAGIVAGSSHGFARNSSIYSIEAFESPMNVLGSLYNVIATVKDWHNKKSIIPSLGYRKHTVVNMSLVLTIYVLYSEIVEIDYRGQTFSGSFNINGLGAIPWSEMGFPIFGENRDANGIIVNVDDPALSAIIQECIHDGIIFTLSAGNDATTLDIPAGVDSGNQVRFSRSGSNYFVYTNTRGLGENNQALVVAALSAYNTPETLSSYSNRGPGVDIIAPGDIIRTSVYKSNPVSVPDSRNVAYKFGLFSGTSAAAPHVAGVIANMLEAFPSADQSRINSIIKALARPNQITGVETTSSVTAIRNTPNLLVYYPQMSFIIQPDRLTVSEREIINFRIVAENVPNGAVFYVGIGGDIDPNYIIGGIGFRRISIFDNEALLSLTFNIDELVPGKYFYLYLIAGDYNRSYLTQLAKSENISIEPKTGESSDIDFGSLSEWFNPDIYEYYLEYDNIITNLNFLIDFVEPNSQAEIEFTDYESNTIIRSSLAKYMFSDSIQLIESQYSSSLLNQFTNTNIVKVHVSSPALSTSTYTFYIERYGDPNNELVNLSVIDLNLDPEFQSNIYTYGGYVSNSTTSILVIAEPLNTSSIVTVNGIISTGTAISVPLVEGSNSVPVLVTNYWNTDINRKVTQGYNLIVYRNPPGFSNDARLSSISILELPFSFDKDVYNYYLTAPYTLENAKLLVTSNAKASSIKIQNVVYNENTSTTSSSFLLTNIYRSVPLAVGPNNITIDTLAIDNITTASYNLFITREGSITTDLSDIQVSHGFLSPYFSEYINEYQVNVPYEIDKIKIRMIESTSSIYVKYVNSVRVLDDRWSNDINLVVGSNNISINVIAQNRITSEIYNIKVIRSSIPTPITTATSTLAQRNALGKPVWITPLENLGTAVEGTDVSFLVTASTGSYKLISGKLPTGLTLNTSTGLISGVVANFYDDENWKFVLRAQNSYGLADKTFIITVIGRSFPDIVTRGGLLKIGPSNESYIVNGMYVNFQLSATTDVYPINDKLTYFIADGDGELPKGLTLSSSGLIYGKIEEKLREVNQISGKDEYDKYKYDTLPYDFETLFGIGSSGRYINKLYDFTLSVSNGLIVTKRDYQIQVYDPVYLYSNGKPNEYPIAPQWMIDADLGEFKANSYVVIELETHDPDPGSGIIYYEYAGFPGKTFPPDLTIDSENGVLFGWLNYTSQYKTEYNFTIRVYKENKITATSSFRPRQFKMTVVGVGKNKLEFITASDLGSLFQGQTSEIDIIVEREKEYSILIYSLISGSLPPGITLSSDGHLQGYIPYNTGITNDVLYTFTIKVTDNNLGHSISRQFTLTARGYTGIKYANLSLKPLLSDLEKQIYNRFIEDTDIFKEEYIYRPNDPAFGLQKEIKFILNPAIESLSSNDTRYSLFVTEIQKYFYRKRLYFGGFVKIRAADHNNLTVYEVVCCDLQDEYQREWGTIAKELEVSYGVLYPNSINNIVSSLEKYARINYAMFPRFMQTVQDSFGLQFRSRVFMIICFCKPGYADRVIEKINQADLELNKIHFDFERLQYNNSLTPSQYKYLLFPNRKPLL